MRKTLTGVKYPSASELVQGEKNAWAGYYKLDNNEILMLEYMK